MPKPCAPKKALPTRAKWQSVSGRWNDAEQESSCTRSEPRGLNEEPRSGEEAHVEERHAEDSPGQDVIVQAEVQDAAVLPGI